MNVIQPRLPSGYTFFCDDIRFEMSGKVSLIGIYSAVMLVKEFPTILPQLWASIYFLQSPNETRPLSLRLLLEVNGEDRILQEAKIEHPNSLPPGETEGFQMAQMNLQLQMPHFQILEEGRLKVRAYLDDDEIRLGALDIKKAP
ncbi:hypothetical protein [Aquidulcibacter sp.]|uniref:DUF6941 family protein n=1 Tax=Aquidulcibacter sp. TaxID=2052990 RepID=UPI0025BDDDAF|nr:hypothetical protein [Aquidulcibacter sp.]MCA3697779.1 hypothetical protein [Aquidulcibacter sp.]